MGGKYSDPDLAAGIGSRMPGFGVYARGGAKAKTVGCGSPGSKVLKKAEFVLGGRSESRAGRFVSGCADQFSERRCTCLVQSGQTVLPGPDEAGYDRVVIRRIIESNPFLGLQIPMQCGIVTY